MGFPLIGHFTAILGLPFCYVINKDSTLNEISKLVDNVAAGKFPFGKWIVFRGGGDQNGGLQPTLCLDFVVLESSLEKGVKESVLAGINKKWRHVYCLVSELLAVNYCPNI